MSARDFDLAVAGAGIMGLGCALEAARSGRRVAVFDAFAGAGKASWAAAGILVTRDGRTPASPFRDMYLRSIRAFPAWLDEVGDLSGIDVALHRGGDFQIHDLETKSGRDSCESMRRQLDRERARAYTVTDRIPDFLRPFCPLENVKVFHFPGEAHVNNRELLAALLAACRKTGVEIFTDARLQGWQFRSGRSELVFPDFALTARQLLVAAGVWSGGVLAVLGLAAPMVPVKGQMMRIPKFHDEACMIHFNGDMYLIPRGDSLIVGATTEPGIWDEGFDEKGSAYLGDRLSRLLPGAAATPMETWSGIRPRTRDRLPLMGWLDAEKGLAMCSGHYKSGISMAPLSSLCLAKLLNGEKPPVDLEPFNPWRKGGVSKIP